MKFVLLAALILVSVSSYAESTIRLGDFFTNSSGEVIRIDNITDTSRNFLTRNIQIRGSNGQTYREYEAFSSGSVKPEESTDYLAVQIPAKSRSEAPKVLVKRVMQELKNRAGEVVAYVVAEDAGTKVVQAAEIKSYKNQLIPGKRIADYIRNQPAEKLVDFTWGTLESGITRIKVNQDNGLVDLVRAAQTRRNYFKSELAGVHGYALSGLSLRISPELVGLLKYGVRKMDLRAASAAKPEAEIAREAVNAAEGAR